MTATSPAPGWYPDPKDKSVRRYWDGKRWTDERKPKSRAPLWISLAVVLAFGGCAALMVGHENSSAQVMDKDGTYYHVSGSQAGLWETEGSARTTGRPCNWMRLSEDWTGHGTISDLARYMVDRGDVAVGQKTRVNLREGEYFVSYGCRPWRPVG